MSLSRKTGCLSGPVAIVVCLLAASCSKTGAELFKGSYTYKISGTVGLVATASLSTENADTVVMNLVTEQGQMNVARDNSSDKIVMTWNDLGGDACLTMAAVDGKTVQLDSSQKIARVQESLVSYDGAVTFSGNGQRYDNMLILHLIYSGEFKVLGIPMTVVTSNIECVAKANE